MKHPVDRFWFRLLVLLALLVPPFVRMLLQHDYGFWYPEVAALLLLLTGVSAGLAGVLRKRWMFHGAVLVLLVVLSSSTLRVEFFPSMRVRYLLSATALGIAAAMFLMKAQFYRILLVFIFGVLSVDVSKGLLNRPEPVNARAAQSTELPHVVHLIFDGMMGLAGMPTDIAECTAAADHLGQVLRRGSFDTYAYAFSNYLFTRDSIPSILNGRLLKRQGEFLTAGEARPLLQQNLYFDEYRRNGYTIRAYQSNWMQFASGNSDAVRTREYNFASLKTLHELPMSWQARLGQLLATFRDSDRLWSKALVNVFPARIPVGPLTSKYVWPDQVVADYRTATQKTLFFVHLLIPHSPYVYSADGSFTDPREWSIDTEFPVDRAKKYLDDYRQYCAQAHFAGTQLQTFLDKLKSAGLYNSTTVIIHGDHGSRLRLISSADMAVIRKVRSMTGPALSVVRYDYASEPDSRSLLNRFSTLLAIKKPGATMPHIVSEPGSVLYFLRQAFQFSPAADTVSAMNSVYMFNLDGTPRPIRTMTQAFADGTQKTVRP
jgi:hypothetical protein